MRQYDRFGGFVLLEMGLEGSRAAAILDVSTRTLTAWRQRFVDGPDIWDAPRGGRPRKYGKEVENRLIAFYCQTTPLTKSGKGRWTLRTAARELGGNRELVGTALSRCTIARMLARHGLKPHLVRYFLHVTDPGFFPKMERLIALYLSDARHIYSFDECPGLQVLKRLAPNVGPGNSEERRRWLAEFEYIRNGTVDVFAFLEVRTGKVKAECHRDHKKPTFLSVFRNHVASAPQEETLHYVMDNLDSHCSYDFCELVAELSNVKCPSKSKLDTRQHRRNWLESGEKRIAIHFTPFHGSWLNMVEIWFRIMGRTCLTSSYDSPDQLIDAILEYAEMWSEKWAHPFKWTYDGTGLHQKVVRRFISMLKGAADEISLQLMTKQALLMVNLMDNYWDQVDSQHWRHLFDVVHAAEPKLRSSIATSSQPIVKKKTEAALEQFLARIQAHACKFAGAAEAKNPKCQ